MEETQLSIPMIQLNENQNYWLIRTKGGQYYQDFLLKDFIAINWDYFNDFTMFENDEKKVRKRMVERITEKYPEERAGYIFNTIRRFLFDIKPGDLIIIPSSTDDIREVAFGVVESHPYIFKGEINESQLGTCPFRKRRKVKWLKRVKRDELDPYLYRLLSAHNTISEANEYASYIDRTLHSFYFKNDKGHLVLRVEKEDEIYARDLLELIDCTVDIVDIFNDATGSKYNSQEIEIKLNVQSPGPVELLAAGTVIMVIGYFINLMMKGDYEVVIDKNKSKKEEIEVSEKIIDFQKRLETDHKLKSKFETTKSRFLSAVLKNKVKTPVTDKVQEKEKTD